MKLKTLLEVFKIAQLQEQTWEMLTKKQKILPKGDSDPTPWNHKNHNNSLKVTNSYRISIIVDVKLVSTLNNVRKISPQELQERKEKGFCFKCGKKYGLGISVACDI